jgi:hypothetical protein
MADLLLGQVIRFDGDPFAQARCGAVLTEGAVLVDQGGRIAAVGEARRCARAIRRPRSTTMGKS